MKLIYIFVALMLMLRGPIDCAGWNTDAFFRAAEVSDVIRCLQAGADANARVSFDRTPLHMAAESNANPSVIVALLDAGADPNARTENGWAPLHEAAWNTLNPAVIATLVDAGADLTRGPRVAGHPCIWRRFSTPIPP